MPRLRRGDRDGAGVIDRHPQQPRRTTDDPRELLRGVVLESVLDAEAVAQRSRQEAGPGRRADQGERRQLEGDDATRAP